MQNVSCIINFIQYMGSFLMFLAPRWWLELVAMAKTIIVAQIIAVLSSLQLRASSRAFLKPLATVYILCAPIKLMLLFYSTLLQWQWYSWCLCRICFKEMDPPVYNLACMPESWHPVLQLTTETWTCLSVPEAKHLLVTVFTGFNGLCGICEIWNMAWFFF